MKVLIATPLYPPQIGGPATHTVILESGLAAYNIDVVVLPFSRVGWLPKVISHSAYLVLLFFNALNAKVIYALDPVSVGMPARVVCAILRKPLILRVAGDYAWEQGVQRFGVKVFLDEFVEKRSEQPFRARRLAKVEAKVAKGAKHVIVPSSYLKGIVEKWGVSKEQITVVENSYEPSGDISDASKFNDILSGEGKAIMSAGRLVPWKGFRTLIELLSKLHEEFPDLTLIIAGDGPQRPSLEARVKELQIEQYVHFTGNLPANELRGLIARTNLFVLNTAYEGFSHQLLEVMSLGVPIVSTTVGGNSELIENESEGFLVPYDDKAAIEKAITLLLRNSELRERFTAQASSKAKTFSKDKMTRKVASVLKAHSE